MSSEQIGWYTPEQSQSLLHSARGIKPRSLIELFSEINYEPLVGKVAVFILKFIACKLQ